MRQIITRMWNALIVQQQTILDWILNFQLITSEAVMEQAICLSIQLKHLEPIQMIIVQENKIAPNFLFNSKIPQVTKLMHHVKNTVLQARTVALAE